MESSSSPKIQRILIEVQYVYNAGGEEEHCRPLDEGLELDQYIEEEVIMGNFIVRKTVVEDYNGANDKNYKSILEEDS
jgi:hypothetical protein